MCPCPPGLTSRADTATAEHANAGLRRTVPGLDDARGKRTVVQRHEQRLEARRQGFDGRLRGEMAERGELGAPESAEGNGARTRPAGASRRCRRGSRTGPGATRHALAHRRHRRDGARPALADFDVQVAGDRVLRIQLQGGVERRGRLVQLPELEAASRQPRPRSLIGWRQPGDVFVDLPGISTEVAALGKIDGALLEGCQLVHSRNHTRQSCGGGSHMRPGEPSHETRRSGEFWLEKKPLPISWLRQDDRPCIEIDLKGR
jgi:hypothetical protein